MKSINSIAVGALFFVLMSMRQHKTVSLPEKIFSKLWGERGETWDTTKIPDFTNVGYKNGGSPIPDFPIGATVTDFGAVADGTTDNTEAFRRAIAACPPNHSVYIPSGTYLFKDTLVISKSNISITSNVENPAALYFEKGLEELYPSYDKKGFKKTEWSWSGAMITFSGKTANSGIANVAITFPDSVWTGHNFHERGYDAIGFAGGAHDDWVKNVTVTGADLGIWIAARAHHITAQNFVLRFGAGRGGKKTNGHHGMNVYGGYNLFENFKIEGRFQHDLSVEGKSAVYNVFRNVSANDLCIDHHNYKPTKNLFTNINAGAGRRLYASGGKEKPRGICFGETFWNITAGREMGYPDEKDDAVRHSSNNVCVGIKTARASVPGDAYGNWFETVAPADLYPQDLYLAQMERAKRN